MFDDDGALMDEHVLPANYRIGLDGLIQLYGYREQDPDQRRCREKFLSNHHYIGEKVLAAAFKSWPAGTTRRREFSKDAVAALHWVMHTPPCSAAGQKNCKKIVKKRPFQ